MLAALALLISLLSTDANHGSDGKPAGNLTSELTKKAFTSGLKDALLGRRPKQDDHISEHKVETPAHDETTNTHRHDSNKDEGGRSRSRETSLRGPDGDRALRTEQQRKHRQEARRERERIVKQIERDRIESKLKTEMDNFTQSQASPVEQPEHSAHGGFRPDQECAIHVRLLDGSSVRARFSSTKTIRSAIRPWIDSRRSDGDSPYTLGQIMTPQPTRHITISEEEDSLQELKLTPSATLVMISVEGIHANAYEAQSNYLTQGFVSGYRYLSKGAALLAQGARLVSSNVTPASTQNTSDGRAQSLGTREDLNVHTLRNQNSYEREDTELYNGNHLNFEPREQDDRDEEER